MIPNDDIDLYKIPCQAFTSKTRQKLASMLNDRKLTPTDPRELRRDYRGLAELMGMKITYRSSDHMSNLLEKTRNSIGEFQEFLEKIDRFDVLDDCRELFYNDAVAHLEEMMKSPLKCQNKADYLTIDDIMESNREYDAFLLYADEDIDFAEDIVKTLESDGFNLRICVKDRILGGSVLEHRSVMELISQRCRHLIVLLSDDFVGSDMDNFYLEFARRMGWEKGNDNRFIIPVAYKPYKKLPEHHNVYWILHFNRHNIIVSFWDTLFRSITPIERHRDFEGTGVLPPTQDIPTSRDQSLGSQTPLRSRRNRRKSFKSAMRRVFNVFRGRSGNAAAAAYCAS